MAWYADRPFLCYLTAYVTKPTELGVSYANVDTPASGTDWDSGPIDGSAGYSINEQTNAIILTDGSLALVYRTTDGLKFKYYTAPEQQ